MGGTRKRSEREAGRLGGQIMYENDWPSLCISQIQLSYLLNQIIGGGRGQGLFISYLIY